MIIGRKLQAVIQPTTVSDYCQLTINSPLATSVRVEIFRSDGQTTGQIWTVEVENEHVMTLSLAQLPAGSYFALVQGEQEKVVTQFFKL